MNEAQEQRKEEIKKDVLHSIKQTEETEPCDSSNPALVCFAQALMPTVQAFLKESNTPMEGLIASIAEALSQGIALGQHSGAWALLAREEFKTSLRSSGFDSQEYPGEEEEVFRAYFMAHPLSHINPEQEDEDMQISQRERVHVEEVDAAYEAGKAAAES